MKKIRTTVNLTLSEIEALQKLSAKTGMSVSEIVRRAIDEYLKKEGGRK